MPLIALLLAALAGVAILAQLNADAPALDVAEPPAPDVPPAADPTSIVDTALSAGERFLNAVGKDIKKLWSPPAAAGPYLDAIGKASTANGLPEGLLARVLYQESRFRQDIINGTTKSPVGALGIAQFMAPTARDLNVDPLNPSQAIEGAARYLRQLFDALGSWEKAVGAYNWGQGNVKKKGLANAPAETRNYISQVLSDIGLS